MTTETRKWPPWATLRAEEIRATLPPEEWGPWQHQGPCLLSNNNTGSNHMPPHPTEAPNFFYCKPHLQAIKERNSTIKPWPTRDQGLCSSCGGDAALLPVTMADPVACVQAEKTNSTVARLKTARRCRNCQAGYRPDCRGRTCRAASNTPLPVQPANCCQVTTAGTRKHCKRCCSAVQENRRQRNGKPRATLAGLASGKAKRKKRVERRNIVSKLMRQGLNIQNIAAQTGVSVKTATEDVKALRKTTERARDANLKRFQQRLEDIEYLHNDGLNHKEIASLTNLTVQSVKRNIKRIQEDHP